MLCYFYFPDPNSSFSSGFFFAPYFCECEKLLERDEEKGTEEN